MSSLPHPPLLLALLAAVLLAGPAAAEPPSGMLEAARTDRFVFYATAEAHGVALHLSESAEEIRSRIAADVGRDYPGITEVRLAHDKASFQKLQPEGSEAPAWAAGIAYPGRNVVVINIKGGPRRASPGQILAHEVSHLSLMRLSPTGFPRWFLEGMATHHAQEFDLGRIAALAAAVVSDQIISLEDLTAGWPQDPADVQTAYAESIALVSWIHREHGSQGVQAVVRAVLGGAGFEQALEEALGAPLWKVEREWRDDLRVRYTWLPALTSSGFVWGLMSLLFLAAYLRRRRENARKLEVLGDELVEAEEPAAPPEPEPAAPGEAVVIPLRPPSRRSGSAEG